METKSRYEVMADLEERKRKLISERDGLEEALLERQKELKLHDRKVEDLQRQLDRQREDLVEGISNFEAMMESKKATLNELIASVDQSLARFNTNK